MADRKDCAFYADCTYLNDIGMCPYWCLKYRHRDEVRVTRFCMVWMAYKRLYDKPCEIWWDYHEEDNHVREYGFTDFPNDGSIPTVIIYSDHPVSTQVETLAHELAHVAVGVGHEHDSTWEEAFEAIHAEFDRIGDEMFGGAEDGK